jgi:hypothetical protein
VRFTAFFLFVQIWLEPNRSKFNVGLDSANGAAIVQPRAQRSAALGKGAEKSKALKGRNRENLCSIKVLIQLVNTTKKEHAFGDDVRD